MQLSYERQQLWDFGNYIHDMIMHEAIECTDFTYSTYIEVTHRINDIWGIFVIATLNLDVAKQYNIPLNNLKDDEFSSYNNMLERVRDIFEDYKLVGKPLFYFPNRKTSISYYESLRDVYISLSITNNNNQNQIPVS